jgi:hypothetical protein
VPGVGASTIGCQRALGEKRGIGDDAVVGVVEETGSAAFGAAGGDVHLQYLGPTSKAVALDVVARQGQRHLVLLGQCSAQIGAMRQRHQGCRADPAAQIEQPSAALPHRCAEQHAVEPGPEATARLRHKQPPAQKGVARHGLVFYNGVWLV